MYQYPISSKFNLLQNKFQKSPNISIRYFETKFCEIKAKMNIKVVFDFL